MKLVYIMNNVDNKKNTNFPLTLLWKHNEFGNTRFGINHCFEFHGSKLGGQLSFNHWFDSQDCTLEG